MKKPLNLALLVFFYLSLNKSPHPLKPLLYILASIAVFYSCSDASKEAPQQEVAEVEETLIINKFSGDTIPSGVMVAFDTNGTSIKKTAKVLSSDNKREAYWERKPLISNVYNLEKLATKVFCVDSSENLSPSVCDSLPPKQHTIEPNISLVREPEIQDVSSASYSDNAQFDIKNLGVEEGMPTNMVLDVIKDSSGNVWLASDKGLIRYDGLSIKTYDQSAGLPENYITCLSMDPESNIWMGTRSSGYIKFNGDEFYHYPIDSIALDRQVSSISFDKKGVMWSAVQFGGFVKFDGEHFYTYQHDQGIEDTRPTTSVAADENNIKWCTAFKNGLYSIADDGTVRRWNKKGASALSSYINHVFFDPEGKAVYSHWGGIFSVVDGDSVSRYDINSKIKPELILEMAFDHEGNYWVAGYGAGVFKVSLADKTVQHFGEEQGLGSDYVSSIFVDDQGLVWAGTEKGGLSCIKPRSFINQNKYNGYESHIINEVFETNKVLYYATNKGIYRKDSSGFFLFKGSLSSPNSRVSQTCYDILVDSRNTIWSVSMNAGVNRIDSKGQWIRMGGASYGVDHNPTCLDTTSDGHVWIGGLSANLSEFDDTSCHTYGYENGLAIRDLSDLLITDEDVIWLGSTKTGLGRLYKDSIIYYTTKEGLWSNVIHDLKEDKEDRLWVSTELGLNYFENGELKKVSHPAINGNVLGTIQDDKGRYWIATESELLVLVPKARVSDNWKIEDYELKTFDNKNGLSNTGFLGNSIFINSDNLLMVGSAEGLVTLQLDELEFDHDPPVCYLQSIRINGLHIDYRAMNKGIVNDSLPGSEKLRLEGVTKFNNVPKNLSLPHDLNHLTFEYSGMNWDDPSSMTFYYYLEGYEENWNIGRSNNIAEYRNLDFGEYTFHLKAKSRDGLESEEHLFTFEINRPWWRTWWAIGLFVLFILLGVFGIVKWRTKELTKRQIILEREIEQATAKIRKQKELVEAQKEDVERAHEELNTKNQEILDSINYAKRIQNAILPPQSLIDEHLPENFILYLPKDIVAGDFYWMVPNQDNVLIAAADCTGHGVPGAMVSVICNNGLNRSVREFGLTSPGEILDKTRELVVEEFKKSEEDVKDGMDIALCSLQITPNGASLLYAGANNPLWIIRNGSQELEEIKPDKQPIGVFDIQKPFSTHSIELEKGDTFYIFSDGYSDQFGGEKGKKMKASNFKKALIQLQASSMNDQFEKVNANFEKWKGEFEQLDDVCVIGIRI